MSLITARESFGFFTGLSATYFQMCLLETMAMFVSDSISDKSFYIKTLFDDNLVNGQGPDPML